MLEAASHGPTAVVAVNYFSVDLLTRCLVEFEPQDSDFLIVVVDNSCDDVEFDKLQAISDSAGWRVVRSANNDGFGAAVNQGVEAASELGCTSAILINPDATIARSVAMELKKACAASVDSIYTPQIDNADGTTYFRGSELDLHSGRIRGVREDRAAGTIFGSAGRPWLTGACMAFDISLFLRIGGFRNSYFMYWEDIDLSYRAQQLGIDLRVRTDLRVVHDEGGTQGPRKGRAKSNLYYYYNTRNRLIFAATNLSKKQMLRWFALTPKVSWEILMRGGRRQLLQSPRPLLAAVGGSMVGAAKVVAALVRRKPPVPGRESLLLAHPSAELYGADRVFLETVSAVVQPGRRVVVTLPVSGPLVEELTRRGAEVVICRTPVLQKSALKPLGFARLVLQTFVGIWPAFKLVRQAGTGGIYVSTVTIPLWQIVGRLSGRRVTVHVHEAERTAPAPVRALMALPVRLAHVVIANSNFSLETLFGSRSRMRRRSTVIYNGVVGPDTVSPARADIAGPVRLLFIGRLSPRKGPQFAVEVVAQLRSLGTNVTIDLLGSVYSGYEWFEEQLRATVAVQDLEDHVVFLGFRPDVWPEISKADIVLIPSMVDEPFGNTAVEGVLAARPVVVSKTSGLREAAKGYASAQIVEPGDVNEWSAAIQRVVAGWDEYRAQALSDSQIASDRHNVGNYRKAVAAILFPDKPDAN